MKDFTYNHNFSFIVGGSGQGELNSPISQKTMFGTKESNRGAFLEATREARAERAAERRRDEAAVKIQASIRGWLVRMSQDREIRSVLLLYTIQYSYSIVAISSFIVGLLSGFHTSFPNFNYAAIINACIMYCTT